MKYFYGYLGKKRCLIYAVLILTPKCLELALVWCWIYHIHTYLLATEIFKAGCEPISWTSWVRCTGDYCSSTVPRLLKVPAALLRHPHPQTFRGSGFSLFAGLHWSVTAYARQKAAPWNHKDTTVLDPWLHSNQTTGSHNRRRAWTGSCHFELKANCTLTKKDYQGR